MIGKVSQWAKSKGFTRQNAYKILKRHNIPWNKENHTLDFEEADRIWNASKNPAKQAGGAAGGEARQNQTAIAFDEEDADDLPDVRNNQSLLGKAQLSHLLLRVKEKRLTLEQMEGRVVSIAAVREFEARVFSMVKSALLVIGSELQDDLANETSPVKCRQMVDSRIFRRWETSRNGEARTMGKPKLADTGRRIVTPRLKFNGPVKKSAPMSYDRAQVLRQWATVEHLQDRRRLLTVFLISGPSAATGPVVAGSILLRPQSMKKSNRLVWKKAGEASAKDREFHQDFPGVFDGDPVTLGHLEALGIPFSVSPLR